MSEERKYDVVVWGATGFTGAIVAEYLTKQYGVDGTSLRWAIAGRNAQKLEKLREDLKAITPDADAVDIITGDSNDLASLKEMAAQTKVICTTVGPYAKYGAKMVQACVEEGAHYCDLTGEVQFIHQMVESHHEAAKAKKLRITHCCGYDSIPSDIGTLMLQEAMQEKHGGPCEEVKYYAGPSKGAFSGGTVASMLLMMEQRKDKKIRRVLGDPYSLYPEGEARGKDGGDQSGTRWDGDLKSWTAPFVMAAINTRVVRRSNALRDFEYGRDFRYSEVMAMPKGFRGWSMATTLTLAMGSFMGLSAFGPTRKLLASNFLPKPGDGPSKEAQEKGYFTTWLIGKHGPHKLHALIKGPKDPGYGSTAIMLAEAAIALAQDQEHLPQTFGVVTPGSTIGLHLADRLRKVGFTFEVNDEFKAK